jgi:hypothetical protein
MSEVPAPYLVLPEKTVTHQLAERCRRLERELQEAREALWAAERRENDLIERMREGL